jgi:hypothetical protein
MSGWRLPPRQLVLLLICVVGLFPTRPADAAEGTPVPARGLVALERAVDEIDALVLAADFQGAIERAEATRPGTRDLLRTPEALRARARLEVLLSTAQIALGDRPGARRSMQRAVYVWPLLSLDERTTSPRVVRLFRAVRGKGKATRSAR